MKNGEWKILQLFKNHLLYNSIHENFRSMDINMLQPKFVLYITPSIEINEHGVKYNVLNEDATESLKQEYFRLIQSQDDEAAKGGPVMKY